jgi:hypothetical protein
LQFAFQRVQSPTGKPHIRMFNGLVKRSELPPQATRMGWLNPCLRASLIKESKPSMLKAPNHNQHCNV